MNMRHDAPGERPGNDQIQREAAYMAACQGWYDTSEAAQRSNLLRVSVTDVVKIGESRLPAGATHRFFVCIDNTSCLVTRYPGGNYEVLEYDQTEPQRQERELRKAVMDMALSYLTGYSPDPHQETRQEKRAAILQTLFEGIEPNGERDGGPVVHPVISESLLPDIFSTGSEAKMRVLRQWAVQIGDLTCEVGLLRYGPEPELIARDARAANEADEGEEGEEAGVHVGLKDRIAMIKSLFPHAEGEELIERLKAFQAILNDSNDSKDGRTPTGQ